MEKITYDVKGIKEILAYLSQKPYLEVNSMVNFLQNKGVLSKEEEKENSPE